MKLYLVKAIKDVDWDEYQGTVVAATSKVQAKKLADTLPVVKPYRCNEIGDDAKGCPRIILSDFNAG